MSQEPTGSGDEPVDDTVDDTASGGRSAPLPSWNRSRTKRNKKQSPADDAFTRSVRGAGQAAFRTGPAVLGTLALFVAALSGGVYFYKSRASSAAEASAWLGRAAALESRTTVGDAELLGLPKGAVPPNPLAKDEDSRASAAARALGEVPSSPAEVGRMADLLRAAAAMRGGEPEQALDLYEAFTRSTAADHAFSFLAHEGIVLAKEASGDAEGALARISDLAQPPGMFAEPRSFYRDVILAHQGRILESLGRGGEAKVVYRTYHEEYGVQDQPAGVMDGFVRGRIEVLDPSLLAPRKAPGNPSPAPQEELPGPTAPVEGSRAPPRPDADADTGN
ncbi:MAG: hypothetical protein V3V08_17775 [Nannocystaceae bacterium]